MSKLAQGKSLRQYFREWEGSIEAVTKENLRPRAYRLGSSVLQSKSVSFSNDGYL